MKQNRPGIHDPYRYETPSARELYTAYINSNIFFLHVTMPENVFKAFQPIVHAAITDNSGQIDTLCALCAFIKAYLETWEKEHKKET